jgi:hypothetical protein
VESSKGIISSRRRCTALCRDSFTRFWHDQTRLLASDTPVTIHAKAEHATLRLEVA